MANNKKKSNMKKLSILASALMGMLAFASCQNDTCQNPTAELPDSFVLNTPAYAAANVYDLASGTSIELTAKQPEYGYTAPVVYTTQMSLTNKWIDATSADADDATYYTLDGSSTSPKIMASTAQIDKGIMKLAKISDASQLTAYQIQKVYVRLKASLGTTTDYDVYSNVIVLNVMPYFMMLKNADPDFWYLTGAAMGDGNWAGYADAFPLSLVDGYTYDSAKGTGVFQFTGYFLKDNGFKLKHDPTAWTEQWGSSDGGITSPVMNDGGSKDFKVPADGYYTVTLNNKTNTLSIAASTSTPTTYSQIGLIGFAGDWNNDVVMDHTMGPNSHAWVATVKVKADTEFKFRADAGWTNNWGGANGKNWGILTGNGANIPITAGTWVIYFNDIDGFFMMVQQ
jgi:hypothetical protein